MGKARSFEKDFAKSRKKYQRRDRMEIYPK
jgi:hypothetical protein